MSDRVRRVWHFTTKTAKHLWGIAVEWLRNNAMKWIRNLIAVFFLLAVLAAAVLLGYVLLSNLSAGLIVGEHELWVWVLSLAASVCLLGFIFQFLTRVLTADEGLAFYLFEPNTTEEKLIEKNEELRKEKKELKNDLERTGDENSSLRSQAKHLSGFAQYLQRRMDLVAQISTSSPSWNLPIRWNEIAKFKEEESLLDNIVRSDNIDLSHLELNFKPPPRDRSPGALVDVPHGHVGLQALYTILENLIRNAAKHSSKKELKKVENGVKDLKFEVLLEDDWSDDQRDSQAWEKNYFRLRIKDNLELKDREGLLNGLSLSLGSSEECEIPVPDKLENYLAEPIIDPETAEPKGKHWGMKEIKICAAHLRAIKPEEIDLKFDEWRWIKGKNADGWEKKGSTENPPLVEVDGEEGNLRCTFYLQRSKTALVVGNEPEPSLEEFEQEGFDFCSMKELRALVKRRAVLRHKFLVLQDVPADREWLKKNLSVLPFRILWRSSAPSDVPEGMQHTVAPLKDDTSLTTPVEYRQACWESWNGQWYSDSKIYVHWSKHENTFADEGGKGNEPPALGEGKWIVFAHPEADGFLAHYDTPSVVYHQSFRSGKPISNVLQDLKEKEPTRESAAASVAVIDERIWKSAKNATAEIGVSEYQNRNMKEVWKKRGVHILDAAEAIGDFAEFVKGITPPQGEKFDFIVLHQGIIPDELSDGANGAWQSLQEKARWLILDTGAGKPTHPLAEGLRWVEYSNLSEAVVDSAGDKFRLMDLLWSLRATEQ